jgi:hypothetical protein
MTSSIIDDRQADRRLHAAAEHAIQVAPKADLAAQQGINVTLSSRAAFWLPRHVQDSTSLRHLPYLFWLVETCQPSRTVQLGLGDGVAFMGLCQAVDKLDEGGACIGVAASDAHPLLPPDFAREHESHYADFSTIEASASDYWGNTPHQPDIDLLVIDCALTETMQTGLRADWLPRLSARGLLVILNPHVNASTPAGRAFLDSLKKAHANTKFGGGPDSPQTYCYGGVQPDRLVRLSQLLPNSPDQLMLRQVFQRLGQSLELVESAKTRAEVLRLMQSKLDRLTETLDEREDLLGKLKNELKSSEENEKTQAELFSVLQARFADLQARLTAQTEEGQAIKTKLAEAQEKRQAFYARSTELQAERDQLAADLQARTQDLAALGTDYETRLAALQAQESTRAQEVEALQTKLAEAQEKRQAFYARSTELQAERDQLRSELLDRVADISELVRDYEHRIEASSKEAAIAKRRIQKIEATISWRVSAPFRKIKNAFRS